MASQASLTTRRLRSGDDNVYLIGKCEPKIVGVKLPSNKQVLQFFFYNTRYKNKTINESARQVVKEILPFWEKGRIPTPNERTCVAKVIKLYNEWRSVQKHNKSKYASHTQKRAEFIDNLNDLFDIAHVDALKLITIEEDRTFLIKQREKGRVGSMTCVDKNLENKEKRKTKRLENELRRIEKYREKESATGELYLLACIMSSFT